MLEKKILILKKNIEDINTNPKKENTESMDDLCKRVDFELKKYYVKEAERASEKEDKFIKMINDNLIPSKKSEIIDKLRKMYYVKRLYYLNKINNNLKSNKKVDINLLDHKINELGKRLRDQLKKGSGVFNLQKENELEKRLRDQPKKGSGVFNSQKEFAKIVNFFSTITCWK